MKKIAWSAAALSFGMLFTSFTYAQEKQEHFSRTFYAGTSPAAIIIVGSSSERHIIEPLLDRAIGQTVDAFNQLHWQNPAGEVAKINAASGDAIPVQPTTLAIFKAAARAAEWTGGAFDITFASPVGDYTAIKINDRNETIKLKKKGMQVRFDYILDGFLADLAIRTIHEGGRSHAMVKIGNVFRTLGSSAYGPWKIQIHQHESQTHAYRAMNLVVANTGAATISGLEFQKTPLLDPRTKQSVTICCRGVSIVSSEAALAQGLAYGIYVLGEQQGIALLNSLNKAQGIIVDSNGNLLRSTGF